VGELVVRHSPVLLNLAYQVTLTLPHSVLYMATAMPNACSPAVNFLAYSWIERRRYRGFSRNLSFRIAKLFALSAVLTAMV
jgi:hypothetical protein